jgi:hypothetical protein
MRLEASACVVALLALSLLTSVQAYTEAPLKQPEPWAGYWWPCHDGSDDDLHLWQGGGGIYGDTMGPIFNHDTRYFWLPESIRQSAQWWEITHHRDTLPVTTGHCDGVTCASILEPDTLPHDCGALSQDDLEGLLAEIYSDCALYPRTDTNLPSDIWLVLRGWLGPAALDAKALAVDFDTADVWYFAVYGYRISGDLINDSLFHGVMTLYYERHTYGVQNDPDSAWYDFQCKVVGNTTYLCPIPGTGVWGMCHGPSDLNSPPDLVCTAESMPHDVYERNPYVCDSTLAGLDTLKRVIDHRTIILDDAYMDSMYVFPPPDSHPRVLRPGFAGSCWATDDTTRGKYTAMLWCPRLADSGSWSFYVYKTPPAEGDTLDPFADVGWGIPVIRNGQYWPFSQADPPFDGWQLLGSHTFAQESTWIFVSHWDALFAYHYFTYLDAVRLEFNEGNLEGGASSSSFALSGESQRARVMPNPVWRTACVSYVVAKPGPVEIVVYDVTGRAVQRTSRPNQRAGVQTASFSVAGLRAGTYMARVSASGEHSTCRFVVCR